MVNVGVVKIWSWGRLAVPLCSLVGCMRKYGVNNGVVGNKEDFHLTGSHTRAKKQGRDQSPRNKPILTPRLRKGELASLRFLPASQVSTGPVLKPQGLAATPDFLL